EAPRSAAGIFPPTLQVTRTPWENKRGRAGGPCGPSLGRKRPRRATSPATWSPASLGGCRCAAHKRQANFIAMQKAHYGMAHTPPPLGKARFGHKEGAARGDERPKSREETPKVGYDTSGSRPGHAAVSAYGPIRTALQLRWNGAGCISVSM